MDVNMRQVRAFVSVAQLKSFTRAATLLHISQPALTVQIHKLEAILAVRLLDRNSRTVEITRVGRELLPVFQRILRELDAVIVDTRALANQKHGVVRIAALPSFAAGPLPALISRFRRAHPGMSFVVKDAIASRVTASVRSEEVDIGVTGGDAPGDDLEIMRRSHDQMLAVFPAQHPFNRKRKITLKDLSEHPLVLMDSETSVRAIVDAAFVAAGLLAVPACEATYMMTAVGMVKAGLGVTVLPASAKEIRAEPTLKSRPIDDPAFRRSVLVIKKRSRTLPPAALLFLEDILAALE
ncbi:MAG: LysR family transcriptional regulator [Tardiphaga sp.]|jgi:DNA-binding transcriptional LysR family regulator|nr:LysR family transcriptional regulator [Tardiphaga sp.]